MAITRKQAKIYALRYMAQQCENMFQSDGGKFTVYEEDKIRDEMGKIVESVWNRLSRLGDDENHVNWDSDHVRKIL